MNANLDRWKMRGAIDPPPMPHKKKEGNHSGQLFLWGIIGLAIGVGIVGYLTSCATKDADREKESAVGSVDVTAHLAPVIVTPDINAVAKVTDPNGAVSYEPGGAISIPDPVPGIYTVVLTVAYVTAEVAPGPPALTTVAIRIDGSQQAWIPIDAFGVPKYWESDGGVYKFKITAIDGRHSAGEK